MEANNRFLSLPNIFDFGKPATEASPVLAFGVVFLWIFIFFGVAFNGFYTHLYKGHYSYFGKWQTFLFEDYKEDLRDDERKRLFRQICINKKPHVTEVAFPKGGKFWNRKKECRSFNSFDYSNFNMQIFVHAVVYHVGDYISSNRIEYFFTLTPGEWFIREPSMARIKIAKKMIDADEGLSPERRKLLTDSVDALLKIESYRLGR